MNECCICRADTPTDGSLIDGSVFHRSCYKDLNATADELARIEDDLRKQIRKQPTLGEYISMFFFESRRLRALRHKQALKERLDDTCAKLKSARSALTEIHDVWSGYPPDWDLRRMHVRSRDSYCCAECGVGNMLQLHHKRPISQGGTHRLDNLVLLCRFCHSEAHGGAELRYIGPDSVNDDAPNPVERKMALINRALSEKRDVHFRYKKPDGTVTDRTVTPRQLRKLTVFELRSLVGFHVKIEREGRLRT